MTDCDIVIIGAGPAGLQASLFLGRAKISCLVIGRIEGSGLFYGEKVGNVFGFPEISSGKKLLESTLKLSESYGVKFLKEEVIDLQKKEVFETTLSDGKKVSSKGVIIATGRAMVNAGIQNEKDFFGRGIQTCVACDGPLFKEKKVIVLGNGSHAAQEALELLTYTKKVRIVTQGKEFEASQQLMKRIKEEKIQVEKTKVKKALGEKFLKSIEFIDGKKEELDGIFLALGSASSITFANKIGLMQKNGFLVIDRNSKTNAEGIWAAGGCTGGNQQVAKSMGEACNAAIDIIKKFKGLQDYVDQT
ncbi:MAG TPA: NAD(P)/FAD-dependent oxidoreductase [archaeon]|nr:NAD(P)/FAD-dependent oxidoreductase [archaeon]